MTTEGGVSVVIPVCNGARYLSAAIESVWAQTAPPQEVIVVDDGSQDETPDVIRRQTRPGLCSIRQASAGAAVARNRGAAEAKGEFLAFLDADDLWTADKLALQLKAFARKPQTDMVFGHIQEFVTQEVDGRGSPIRRLPGYSATTMLIRRESFARTGGFDGRWKVGEFIDWYARACEFGLRDVMLPETVTLRRIHSDNQGRLKRNDAVQYAHVIRAALERRRRR
jgi:glycosyltransferase involved in cell wall biosynthesis